MKGKIFVLFFIVIGILVGLVFWLGQKNSYSKEVLSLEILGPEKAQAGEEVEYALRYKNKGSVRLEDLELVFEYPEDSLPLNDDAQRITRDLEDLYPDQEELIYFRARFFGKEGDIKTAEVTLSYRPKNLKPFYESKSTFSTQIESVPITFAFDLPSKSVIGKETKISLNYFSDLEYPLSDLRVKIDYPSGFGFLRSRPIGIERNEWQLGVLNKAEGGRIEIFGELSGGIGQQEMFRAQLGIWLKDHFVLLKEISRGVEIVRPHLIISQRINGAEDHIASPGELLHYEISFRNIGDEFFEKLFLVSQLEGPFDFDSVNADLGKVNTADQSILWDWRNLAELQYLGPGEEGMVEFWVNTKSGQESGIRNPILKNRVSLSQVREDFETKMSSRLALSQKGFFKDDAFTNSGPIPPRVNKTTTYTIKWEIGNYCNEVGNVKIRAVLPTSVELTGDISPDDEKPNFTFDSVSREILWTVGRLDAQSGVTVPQKVLIFQIRFTPSGGQKGLVATLINEARILGEDRFTGKNIEALSAAIDTTLPDDASVSLIEGIVQ